MARRHTVLIVGVDTAIGLTVVRELGEHGVEVHGVAFGPDAVGLHSKWLASGHLSHRSTAHLIETISGVCAEYSIRHVMAISESDILFLNRAAGRFDNLTLLLPTKEQMAKVLDKTLTYEVAREVGLETPRTWVVESESEIDACVRAVSFPVVLKWRDPVRVADALRSARLPLLKAEYCHSAVALRSALTRYAALQRFPLVQSHCPGHGLGQMVLMHGGVPILRFQHRRLHEWPPEGGGSTLCESQSLDSHSSLFERSVALLRSLDWRGPAMVEYRYDPRSDRAVLMEVNGRFWGSLPLAYHSGAHFAWWTYAALGHGILPTGTTYTANLTCQFLVPDTRRLLVILFAPHRIQDKTLKFNRLEEIRQFLGSFFRRTNRYYIESWRDPWPAIMDFWWMAKKAVNSVSARVLAEFRRVWR